MSSRFDERIICPACNRKVMFADIKTFYDDKSNEITILHCSKCKVISQVKIDSSYGVYYPKVELVRRRRV